ncbi:MAG TPA: hypothetical protein VHP11_14300 [Tepidisphaeraceae bacterium]|nr:hypothetical protein [Tepidisphaeraceae bacterium]
MEQNQTGGREMVEERVFNNNPLAGSELPDYDDDLVKRLAALPEADGSARAIELSPEWDQERWDGLA